MWGHMQGHDTHIMFIASELSFGGFLTSSEHKARVKYKSAKKRAMAGLATI